MVEVFCSSLTATNALMQSENPKIRGGKIQTRGKFQSIISQGRQINAEVLNLPRYVNTDHDKRTTRIIAELVAQSACNQDNGVGLMLEDDNISSLLGMIAGPPGTPYEGGIFYVRIKVPEGYPYRAPECCFATRVYHPQIDWEGNFRLNVLEESWWSPMCNLWTALLAMRGLLEMPDVDEPLVPEIANLYTNDRESYIQNARQWTERYANGESPTTEKPSFVAGTYWGVGLSKITHVRNKVLAFARDSVS